MPERIAPHKLAANGQSVNSLLPVFLFEYDYTASTINLSIHQPCDPKLEVSGCGAVEAVMDGWMDGGEEVGQ
jgi:hypothetical protein